MTRDDDSFRPKLNAPRDRAGRPRGFIRQILKAAHRSGKAIGKTRYAGRGGQRPGARLGRGHLAARRAGSSLTARSRRATVKARIVRFKASGSTTAADHLRYIQREAVARDGGPAQLYSASEEAADGHAFEARSRADRHQFRFIVSPEDAAELEDLKAFTRQLMQRAETDLGTRLDWVAADHWDTDNPHTHLVIRGKLTKREDLIISKDYISHGFRQRVAELATEWLGERTTREIEQSLHAQVTQERWTQLDRVIKAHTVENHIDVASVPLQSEDGVTRSQVLGRLNQLSSLGLARPAAASWELNSDVESTLRSLGERGDIIRTLQRATGRLAQECRFATPELSAPIVGRIAGKGMVNELEDRTYLAVDGIDGRAHYVRLPPAANLADFPTGAIVEIKPLGNRAVDVTIARVANAGLYRTADHQRQLPNSPAVSSTLAVHVRRLEALRRAGLTERIEEGVWRIPQDLVQQGQRFDRARHAGISIRVESYLPLSSLPRAAGATWLDRELLRPSRSISHSGFGGEAREALGARAKFLIENGLARRQGQRLILMQNLLATLRERELNQTAAELARQTGLEYRPLTDGQSATGIYRRSITLVSGRFAILENGMGFALVPWRPVIEPKLGTSITATPEQGHISWHFSRHRGISL